MERFHEIIPYRVKLSIAPRSFRAFPASPMLDRWSQIAVDPLTFCCLQIGVSPVCCKEGGLRLSCMDSCKGNRISGRQPCQRKPLQLTVAECARLPTLVTSGSATAVRPFISRCPMHIAGCLIALPLILIAAVSAPAAIVQLPKTGQTIQSRWHCLDLGIEWLWQPGDWQLRQAG